MTEIRWARCAFASGIISLGIVGLVHGDFDAAWRIVPKSFPAKQPLEYASAALLLLGGVGLLFARTEKLATRILFFLLALVLLCLKLPIIAKAPLVEGSWQSVAEMVVIFAGSLALFAGDDERLARTAQVVFALALIPLGLAHFVYLQMTAPLIPAWIPFHTGWAYFTGGAMIAAGLAIIVRIYAKLAATLVAVMLTAFTALVWIPMLLATPGSRDLWSEITASWAVSAGAWVIAASISGELLKAVGGKNREAMR